MSRKRQSPPLEQSFLDKLEKTDTCWNWTAAKNASGYGQIKAHGVLALAHRLSFELHIGPIPPGLQVDHVCRNRGCVNPEHLRLVTRKQNLENRQGPPANNTSGVRGVTWFSQMRKWVARVGHDGRSFYLGAFESLEDAEAAVIAKRLELHTHNELDRQQQKSA